MSRNKPQKTLTLEVHGPSGVRVLRLVPSRRPRTVREFCVNEVISAVARELPRLDREHPLTWQLVHLVERLT